MNISFISDEIHQVLNMKTEMILNDNIPSADKYIYLNPKESINNWQELLNQITNNNCYFVNVQRNTIIEKQLRVFDKHTLDKYKNFTMSVSEYEKIPVLEKVIINSSYEQPRHLPKNKMHFNIWAKNQECLSLLEEGSYDLYCRNSSELLLQINLPSDIKVFHKYYRALLTKDLQKRLFELLECLDIAPELSEIWCGLGEIAEKLGQKNRAVAMYNNAINFGQQRNLLVDKYWIEVNKYFQYPEERINSLYEKLL